MADREKVIKGLEICSDPGSCRSECPYYEKEGAECSYCLLKDALELLKKQEPRVLTWDEVTALPNGEENEAAVVQELKVPIETWDKGTICKWCGARFVQERDHYYYNEETYGTTWRCWTALPTKKQRKAAKWA